MALLSYFEATEAVRRFIRENLPAIAIHPGASRSQSIETVGLLSALGRVLASGIVADRDQPPFARSTRDGFACRAEEANSHRMLRFAGQVRAGETASEALNSGEVWEIMTGAPVPAGADAVFMIEHAQCGDGFVRLLDAKTVAPGENIVPRGAEAAAGALLVPPGVRLSAPHIALAAQCGYAEVAVAPRPRVAILATGDELVAIDNTPGPSQIRNSNSPMLAVLVEGAGGEAVVLPTVADEEMAVDAALASALVAEPDLLLIAGGISAGRFDLVEGGLRRVGAEFFFKGVAMQPGKPASFGHLPNRGKLPFFALPGNPISSAMTFHLFAAPLLAALGGDSGVYPKFGLAHLAENWRGKPGLTRFLPASCNFGGPGGLEVEVRLIPWQGSGDLAAFARANCAVVIPPDAGELPAKSVVRILLM